MGKSLIISSADFSANCVENTNKYKMLKSLPLVDKLDINKYLKTDGSEQRYRGYTISDFIEIPENAKIITGYSTSYYSVALVAYYDSSKSFIGYNNNLEKVIFSDAGTSKGYFKYDIPSNAKYIKMSWDYNTGNSAKVESPIINFIEVVVE